MLKTPFHSFHVKHNAKLVDFAGWEMPIMYASIHEEHRRVREAGGLFDVSHMGRLRVSGRHARKYLERLLTRRITDMQPNQCRYSLMCEEDGGTIDDLLVYRFEDHWLLVVNAANREAVLQHMRANVDDLVVKIEDQTMSTAMVALQGPGVMDHIGRFSREVPTLKKYTFCTKNLMILKMIISRTGYTGEDGVEVILPASMAAMALKLLVKEKTDDPANSVTQPVGLGARDTLRMEAGMPLYGHELSRTIDPITAGLKFAVSLTKDEEELGEPFIGQAALKRVATGGSPRRLIGLQLDGKRTARQGMAVHHGDRPIGEVTSGCLSPTLGFPIAMALVEAGACDLNDTLSVQLGSSGVDAKVVPMPFYKPPKKAQAGA